jgi:pimeloyl-ACP methyl ester carboxylesterase
LHIPRYIDDAIEIAEHLRQRYGKSKVILMAHSWGTVIGLGAAVKRPDLFHAYVGIGQVIDTRDNERISFEYGLQQAKARGNSEAVKEMQTIAPYPGDQPITRERIIIARKWAQFYGGLTAFAQSRATSSTHRYFRPSTRRPRCAPSTKATSSRSAECCPSSSTSTIRVCDRSRSRSSCSRDVTTTPRRRSPRRTGSPR